MLDLDCIYFLNPVWLGGRGYSDDKIQIDSDMFRYYVS